jgi:hypothetical protein
VPAVTRAEALWVLTFAAMKGDTAASWELSQTHAKRAMAIAARRSGRRSIDAIVSGIGVASTTTTTAAAAVASTTQSGRR